jgi:hypothetical protein
VFTRNDHNWTEQAELFASDGHEQDQFGESVSLSGDTALIGAPFDDVNGSDSGSAYVFTRTGNVWTQQAKLLPSDGAGMDYFGGSVSLDNDTAFIGSFHGNGSAYVFTRSGITWTQQQKLIASDGAIYDFFGQPVFLDGDTAFIAATGDDDYGSVYVFKKENHPPDQPTITGPAKGKVGAPTTYNFTTTDPDGDKVYYFIDWGDHTYSSWIGPYPSGELITVFHIWTKKGAYTIKAKAKDIYGNESDWGTLSVTMPTSYNISMLQFLDKLFERFPNAFPILRYLLGY